MPEINLKPCPFCGSENVYIPHIGGRPCGMVCCSDCGKIVTVGKDNLTEEEIAEEWNKRSCGTQVNQCGRDCTHICNNGTLNITM